MAETMTAASGIAEALRGLVDVLTSDLEGQVLYDAIDRQVRIGRSALHDWDATSDRACKACLQVKPITEFSNNRYGPLWTCKPCMSAKKRAGRRRKKEGKADLAARRCHDSGELVLVCRCDRCIADRNANTSKPPTRKPEYEEPAVTTQTVDRAPVRPHAPRPSPTPHPSTPRPAVKPSDGDYGGPQSAPHRLDLATPDGRPAGGVSVPDTTDSNWDAVEAAVTSALIGERVVPSGRSGRQVGRPLPEQGAA